ncbi:RNA-binding S4 domain-containing protein [Oceanospirillum linum]|uniref:RNA-binding protein n=1 Tax=Oceanospirillum linum TaxID=966 RepID=A0A1T1HE37_OCELI|nr:RNA-binding S4 domain-containing protein [Oceanospirillum linum]OOV88072.1 RNA-binding protein [Oceanospirillum linum]SEF42180.1 ribosome-associated protein [Oleiphilus messinensis]SMP00965.1 ribosome-associated protein [Oceanospirillum linum]
MIDVIINREPVELYKILKFENLVSSGGEAKQAIEQGRVQVNGETDTRKRRKIVAGDRIVFEQQILNITLAE